jgi:hypothetical protein
MAFQRASRCGASLLLMLALLAGNAAALVADARSLPGPSCGAACCCPAKDAAARKCCHSQGDESRMTCRRVTPTPANGVAAFVLAPVPSSPRPVAEPSVVAPPLRGTLLAGFLQDSSPPPKSAAS